MSEMQGPPDQIDAILIAHQHDPRAAIAGLIDDLHALYHRLELAQSCISTGFTRGWRYVEDGGDER